LINYLVFNRKRVTCLHWLNYCDEKHASRVFGARSLLSSPSLLVNHLKSVLLEPIRIKGQEELTAIGVRYSILFWVFPPLISLWVFLIFLATNRVRYDVCIASGPWAGITGILIKKFNGAKVFVYEDTDLWSLFYGNLYLKKIVGVMEAFCVAKADLVVSVGELLEDLRRRQGAKRVIIIPNGVRYDLFKKALEKRPHPPTLIYVGLLDASRAPGLVLAIKALPRIIDKIKSIRLLILGPGPYEDDLKKLVKELRLEDSVKLLGEVPHEDLPAFLAESDVGIAPYVPSELIKYGVSQKVVEYIAAGLPVIGTRIGETERMIEKYAVGEAIDYSVEASLTRSSRCSQIERSSTGMQKTRLKFRSSSTGIVSLRRSLKASRSYREVCAHESVK